MAELDDALASGSVVFAPAKLIAKWREAGPIEDTLATDARTDLSEQMTGNYTVEHSIDDALPDPVTMATGLDASGKLTADLNGKEGMVLASSGARSIIGTSSGTSTLAITAASWGADTAYGDYMLCVVTVSDPTAVLTPVVANDPKNVWTPVVWQTDTGIGVWVYLSRYWGPGRLVPAYVSSKPVSYTSQTVSFWAKNPAGNPLDWRITQTVPLAEGSSVTAHTVTTVLTHRGYQVGVWGTTAASAQWSPGTAGTELSELVANGLDTAITTTTLRDTGSYSIINNTTAATAVGVLIGLSLEPYQRPRMDARQYFSPFNTNSPVYGYDRDTADTQLTQNVVTSIGPVGVVSHTGIMQDITLKGRQAELTAVSKTRIDLNATVTLPVVFGYREGCTVDWLCSWLLSRGGKFVGPAPTVYTRHWATMHGSVHSGIGGPSFYNYVVTYNSGGGPFGRKNPVSVPGPFMTAMFAEQTATQVTEIDILQPQYHVTGPELPYYQPDAINGNTRPVYNDVWSQTANRGRVTFWLRGDPVVNAPTYIADPAANDFIFYMKHYLTPSTGGFLGWVMITIRSSDRLVAVQMGSDAAGYTSFNYPALGALTTDGTWNFYGFQWDFSLGKFDMIHNAAEVHTTSFSPSAATAQLPVTDLQGRTLNYTGQSQARFHVPVAEYSWDVPPPFVSGQWANWTTPIAPGATVTTRPTYQWIQAVAEPVPVNVWDTLADLARSSLCAYRANETDGMEVLPPSYFGETAQMTVAVVADTQVNASDLDVVNDPSKTRNVITLQFPETTVTTNRVSVKDQTEAIQLPRGLTTITFTLDTLCAEIHGSPGGAVVWTLTNLSSTVINAGGPLPLEHFMTINTAADGSGTVLPVTRVSAKIQYGDASTITVLFNNQSGSTAYISNNGQNVPFLRLYGYAVTVNDGYVTQRDVNSVASRKERGLTADMPWVQNRNVANELGLLMTTMLARPRPSVGITVVGDPRRKPGQLVQIKDSQGTQAAGTWRVMAVTHNVSGAQYTQNLLLTSVGPIAVWDDPTTTWDNSVWGV
jgi:hypothetical protein